MHFYFYKHRLKLFESKKRILKLIQNFQKYSKIDTNTGDVYFQKIVLFIIQANMTILVSVYDPLNPQLVGEKNTQHK